MPVSQLSARALPSTRPVPAYRDAAIKALGEKLDDARERRNRLREVRLATDALDREILDLRGQLREGGQLLAGDALGDGRYLLVKPIGRGGFSVVWEAYDRLKDQRVALKVLHSHLAGDPFRRDRFFRGARAMRKLACLAVVQVLEPEQEDGGFYYFVMEFVPGGNLSEAVLASRLEKESIFPFMLRVCEAVAGAHDEGMIHRDIKPSNILLDEAGSPKLTDFDLVGARDTTGGTRTGALGTFLYAAPECLDRPQEATARADVYGLGMTTIFCLSGQELTRSIFRAPELAIARLSCSSQLKAVLARAVAWEPGERFANAGVMERALRDALDGDLPPFLTVGSAPSATTEESPEHRPPTPMLGEHHSANRLPTTLTAALHRSPALWLIGTMVAAMTAAAAQMVVSTEERAAASAFTADAERVASVFDASARSAHMRADGIATTPMLRAAIETDATTLSDLASTEMVFTAGKGEELEVYQFGAGAPKSLLRIPKSAPALSPLKGRDTRIQSDGRSVTLLASAPISGYRAGSGGGVVLSTPIDMGSLQHALAERSAGASLTGLGSDLVLVEPAAGGGGTPVKLAVPSSGDWNAGSATLVATPKRAAGLAWAGKARIISGGLSGLLLVGFVVSVVRRPRS